MINESIIKDISELLFNLFVVNDRVIGIQMVDGNYIPQTVNYDKMLFVEMIKKNASLAVYQQRMYSDKIKWVCFDFDIRKGKDEEGSIDELINKYVAPVVEMLKSKGQNYLIEYSGRRGIHIWVIFNSLIDKSMGYKYTSEIISEVIPKVLSDEIYGVDLFPAVPVGRKKLGKAVKLPLSVHRKSKKQSYFIRNIEEFNVEYNPTKDAFFYKEQLDILKDYKLNSAQIIGEDTNNRNEAIRQIYKPQKAKLGDKMFTLSEIIDSTSDSILLTQIWARVLDGQMSYTDRLVIAGVFGNFGDSKLLKQIFEMQDNYNVYITQKMLMYTKKELFPIKMWYLYDLYKTKIEVHINPNSTILEHICSKLNIDVQNVILEKEELKARSIARKELKYLNTNDEVLNPKIIFDLKNMYRYDYKEIDRKVSDIIKGEKQCKIELEEYYSYKRSEKGKARPRKLISLSARDRVVTTLLTYEMANRINWRFNSYSYNLNFWNDKEIFFPWFSSWNKFINDVEIFLKFDLFSDYSFMKIDIEAFYDSIFIHSIYQQMEEKIKLRSNNEYQEITNILSYLSDYNDEIMRNETGGIRGVPQGPVYARVLSEFFISTLISQFESRNSEFHNNYKLFRYVDDIYIIYKNIDGRSLLNEFSLYLKSHGLNVNDSKTKDFGLIGSMTDQDKEEIFSSRHWNYELRKISGLELVGSDVLQDKLDIFERYLIRSDDWEINDANFILGTYLDEALVKRYLSRYFENIISSKYGRGSIFKKFYEVLIADPNLFNRVVKQELYKKIPLGSINQLSFLTTLFFNKNVVKDSVGSDNFIKIVQYLKNYKDEIGPFGNEMITILLKE